MYAQKITFLAHNAGGLDLMGTDLYGENFQSQRTSLWSNLRTSTANANLSWLVMGDFNTVTFTEERLWG